MTEVNFPGRTVMLFGYVEWNTAKEVIAGLLSLEAENPQLPIILLINSFGGDVYSMNGVIDVMEAISCPIITVCTGAAFSAAATILMSGDEGLRFATPNSRIMIHEPTTGTNREGKLEELKIDTDELDILFKMMLKRMVDKTGQTMDTIKADIEKDRYMSATEALEYGIVDHVNFFSSASLTNHIVINVPDMQGLEEVKAKRVKKSAKSKKKG